MQLILQEYKHSLTLSDVAISYLCMNKIFYAGIYRQIP